MYNKIKEKGKVMLELIKVYSQKEEFRKKDDFINADIINKQKKALEEQIAVIKQDMFAKTGSAFGEISAENIRFLKRAERILRDFFTQAYADIKDVCYETEVIGKDEVK